MPGNGTFILAIILNIQITSKIFHIFFVSLSSCFRHFTGSTGFLAYKSLGYIDIEGQKTIALSFIIMPVSEVPIDRYKAANGIVSLKSIT